MKEYHTDLLHLYNMDCMELMAEIPDKAFELAIVDPPYFSGPNLSGYYGKGYSSLGVQRAKYYNECKYWAVPDKQYFKKLLRISKNQIIWGANHFSDKFKSAGPGWIIWDKENGKSSFADAELAYTSFNKAVRIFRYMWNGMHQGSFGGDVSKNEKRIHPTQKPVKLYKWLLENYAKSGYKIVDTHGGSLSIAIACHYMGFELTACELDTDYFQAAIKRIKEETKQISMF